MREIVNNMRDIDMHLAHSPATRVVAGMPKTSSLSDLGVAIEAAPYTDVNCRFAPQTTVLFQVTEPARYGRCMAQKITHVLIDDLDGAVLDDGAGKTISFGLDGRNYEIDLSLEHVEDLHNVLSEFIAAGRRVRATDGYSVTHLPRVRSRSELDALRRWARENGHAVSDRGPVPKPVREAYDSRF